MSNKISVQSLVISFPTDSSSKVACKEHNINWALWKKKCKELSVGKFSRLFIRHPKVNELISEYVGEDSLQKMSLLLFLCPIS